jgi:hypothetical protein
MVPSVRSQLQILLQSFCSIVKKGDSFYVTCAKNLQHNRILHDGFFLVSCCPDYCVCFEPQSGIE